MNRALLIQTCKALGWKVQETAREVVITQTGSNNRMFGEPAIRIRGKTVIWNSYYMKDGQQKVNKLQQEYQKLYDEVQVQYALECVEKEFTSRGFSRINDRFFTATDEVKHQFQMKQVSKLKGETDQVAYIKISILANGTIETDSNYIPEDVHILADEAMETIEKLFGNTRTIRPKEIPAEYRNKAFCKNPNVIKLRQGSK